MSKAAKKYTIREIWDFPKDCPPHIAHKDLPHEIIVYLDDSKDAYSLPQAEAGILAHNPSCRYCAARRAKR